MRRLSLFTGLFWICTLAFSQEAADTTKPWKYTGETNLSFSQVSLTNWAAGGESSMSGNAFFNLGADYTKNKSVWSNKMELAFGLQKLGDADMKKTDDKIYISTSYGYKAGKKWFYNATLSFKSQFANGYNYPNDSVVISKFLAPAYVLGALGMEYKPNAEFSLGLLPVSGRTTIVNDDTLSAHGAFGVEPGKKMRFEFGGSIIMNIKKEIFENVDFTSSLELFSNYLEDPQNIDVTWEVFINMKINDFLSANIATTLLYDNDIMITDKDGNVGPRTQFKEVFGIGLSYKF